VGSTALMQRLGDDEGDKMRRECYAVFRQALVTHGGREVKSTGDGVFAVFPTSVEQAVACGIAMQRGIAQLDLAQPLLGLGLRVGIATGEAKAEDGDWYGTPVVQAERLCTAAHEGQILVANVVRMLAGTRGGHTFRAVGPLELKGLARPLPASEVDWSADDPSPTTPAPLGAPQPPLRHGETEVPLPTVVTAVRQGVFVGRKQEHDRLARAWDEAKAGRRKVVFISGEPGIGKTRLAAELAATAHREGAVVLWGRCDEGLGVAYQPVVEALRHYVRNCPADTFEAQLGRRRPQLARLVPELAEGRSDRAVPSEDAETERLRLFEAVSELLGSVARSRPVLLVQDDLQWATRAALLLLRHLARPAEDRVLIVGNYRDTDLGPDHPLIAVLADLRREPTMARLAVEGLDKNAVAAYVEAATGDALGDEITLDLAPALHAGTEGNPFFVGQVLGHHVETGALEKLDRGWVSTLPFDQLGIPEGVRDVVARRASRLPEATQRVLDIGAVVGRDFTMSVLERIPEAAADADTLLNALEGGVRAGLVQEVPGKLGSFGFVHDVIRQTVYERLSGPRRARVHRNVGDALAGLPGANAQPADLAHHFVAGATAGCRTEAITWSKRAGNRALEQFAYEDAVAHFQRAIELLEWDDPPDHSTRARLLLAEHNARAALGDVSGAKKAASRAVEDARSVGSADLLAETAIARAWWIGAGVPDPETAQLLDEVLAAVDDDDLSSRAAILGARAFHQAVTETNGAAADAMAREAIALARAGDDPEVLADVLAWHAQARILQGSPHVVEQEAVLAELATLPQAKWHLHHGRHGWLDRMAAVIRLQVGDLAGFDVHLERVAQLGDENQDRLLLATAAMWRGLRALLDGRFNQVEDHAAGMLRWAGDDPNFALSYAGQLLHLRWDQGRVEELRPLLLAAMEQAPDLDVLRVGLALVHAVLGEPHEARAHVADIVGSGIAGPRGLGWLVTLVNLVEVCARLGDAEHIDELTTALAPYMGQLLVSGWGTTCLGGADRYLAMLAALGGRLAEAEQLFEAALVLEQSIGAEPHATRTRVAHARALLTLGTAIDTPRAAALLDAAAHSAHQLGMEGVVHEIETLRNARSGNE
jgi:tetratricopeptide (TPR) repeat protein